MATNNAVNTSLSGQTGTGTFVGATSPTLVTPTLGAATATSLAFSPTTGGIIGTATNDNAGAEKVGELVNSLISSATPLSLTTLTVTNLTSISLTAGDWDVWGNVGFTGGATTVIQVAIGFISTSSASLTDSSLYSSVYFGGSTPFATAVPGFCVPEQRLSLASTTTVYLEVFAQFSVSTCSAVGGIYARRRR